jgi:hypothetical protein
MEKKWTEFCETEAFFLVVSRSETEVFLCHVQQWNKKDLISILHEWKNLTVA